MPFLAPGDLERCGIRADAVVVANPLVTEESVLRTALLPGILATLGYNAAHRSTGLAHVPGRPLLRAARRTGRDARRVERARCRARRCATRRPRSSSCRPSPASLGFPEPTITLDRDRRAAPHPRRESWRSTTSWSARWARSTRRCAEQYGVAERVGLAAARPRRAARDRAAPLPQFTPRQPVPVLRHRPRLRAARRRGRASGRGGAASAGATWSPTCRLFDVYRGEQVGEGRRSLALRRAAAGARPHPDRCRGRRGPASGSSTRSPARSRPRSRLIDTAGRPN